MKLLNLPMQKLQVQRFGLPFYDAARIIGVAHLFFGTSNATVIETGFGWIVEGTANFQEPDLHRLWIGDRLRRFERKPNNFNRLANWQQVSENDRSMLQQKWEMLCTYFTNPFTASKSGRENTTGLMDSALALGARGYDLTGYKDLAAESGTPSQQPEAETLAALVGLSHAARINNAMFLLPIFGSVNGTGQPFPITTTRYWNYNRYFTHEGGEKIAATWAMLSMLENLFDQGLPIQDFAYNRADRPIYHSGTLGAEKMCQFWHQGYTSVLKEIEQFLDSTKSTRGGHALDLARFLSEFAINPSAGGLEKIVRLKVRAMAQDNHWAKSLLRKPETLEDIKQMLKIPEVPDNLSFIVGQALALPRKDDRANQNEVPPKEWIGRYLKLENANDAGRLFTEIEHLLARSALAKGEPMLDALTYRIEPSAKKMHEMINDLSDTRVFRAWKSAFLLKVLQNLARQRKSKSNSQPENQIIPVEDVNEGDPDVEETNS